MVICSLKLETSLNDQLYIQLPTVVNIPRSEPSTPKENPGLVDGTIRRQGWFNWGNPAWITRAPHLEPQTWLRFVGFLDFLKPKIAEICGLGTKSADLFLAF
jgi:hypothetical protein